MSKSDDNSPMAGKDTAAGDELADRPEVKQLIDELSDGTSADPLWGEVPEGAQPQAAAPQPPDDDNWADQVVAKPIQSKVGTLPNEKSIEIPSRSAETVKVKRTGIPGFNEAVEKDKARRAAKLAARQQAAAAADPAAVRVRVRRRHRYQRVAVLSGPDAGYRHALRHWPGAAGDAARPGAGVEGRERWKPWA